MNFHIKNIGKPTPASMRKLSKILILISQPSAALALIEDYKIASVVIGSLGLIGAAIAEMYTTETKPEE